MKSITGLKRILHSFFTSSLFKISKHCWAIDSFIFTHSNIFKGTKINCVLLYLNFSIEPVNNGKHY